MPYVQRDAHGLIRALSRDAEPGAEFLPADAPEVLAFLRADADAGQQRFASLDADLVRVLEDLVDALVSRNLLRITDLPPQAQHKLFERKHFRERMQAHALQLFGDTDAGPGDIGGVISTDLPPGITSR